MSERKIAERPKAYSYIRMSTEGQLQGDSLRRQTDRSRQYALENGLDLDETTTFRDIGVSAFRGENLKHGALSRFKEAVLNKQIPQGSYLLVESLDRFSRDDVDYAVAEFLQLLRAGIIVVTLMDGRVFKPGQKDPMDLILSVLMLWRANNESKHKSDRLSQSWANKRARANDRKLTGACPAWLRLSSDRTTFDVIPERAAVIKSIFEDSANGLGNYTITRRLNEKRVPSFMRTTAAGKTHRRGANGWHISYVAKILNNPAVYGTFQPHKFDAAGKRAPEGSVLPNYFPVVVSEETYMRAKHARQARDFADGAAPKGPKGRSFANLFSGLAKCAYCGSSMWFENKGRGSRGGAFLVCDQIKRGLGCKNVRWRYEDFEASFLYFVQELNLEGLLISENKAAQTAVAVQVLQGQLGNLRDKQSKTHELFLANPAATSFVAQKLAEYDAQIAEVEAGIEQANAAHAATKAEASQFDESKDTIKALIDRLQHITDDETYALRARVASSLRSLVTSIRIAGAGTRHLSHAAYKTEQYKRERDWRFFEVAFRDGSLRITKPAETGPLDLRLQLFVTPDGVTKLGDAVHVLA